MAEKKKYNSILVSGRKDQTLTYSKYVKDEESGESVKESLDKKVNVTDELETQQIKDGAITNEKMAADSVGNTNLQDGSVSNEKLEDGSITNDKLAENSITKDKLQDKTIGVEKLDNELRQAIAAATGLPENLVETIQNVDDTLRDHQSQLDDKQSQIDDKQQQINANDEDISLLQTRSTQMEETIKGIAATGGASQATAVTYDNKKSGLTALNAQAAIDETNTKLSDLSTTYIKDIIARVNQILPLDSNIGKYSSALIDEQGNIGFALTKEGKSLFDEDKAQFDNKISENTQIREILSSVEKILDVLVFGLSKSGFVDANGNVALYADKQGVHLANVVSHDVFGRTALIDEQGNIGFAIGKNGKILGNFDIATTKKITIGDAVFAVNGESIKLPENLFTYNTAKLMLPSKIPYVVGQQMYVYYESILYNGFVKDFTIFSRLANEAQQNDCHIYHSSVEEDTINFRLGNSFGNLIESRKVQVKVLDKSKEGNLKICVIGDSKSDNATKQAEVLNLCQKDGKLSVTFVGTLNKTGYDSDDNERTFSNCAISGSGIPDWCCGKTIASRENPFYDESVESGITVTMRTNTGNYNNSPIKFSIEKAISKIGEFDILWIDHGANQQSNEEAFKCYDYIISDVKRYNDANGKNIKVVISVQEGFGLIPQYDSIIKNVRTKDAMYRAVNYIDRYDNRESEGVFICPQYLNVDLWNDFPCTTVYQNSRNKDVTKKVCLDPIHPGVNTGAYLSNKQFSVGDICTVGSGLNRDRNMYLSLTDNLGVEPNDDKVHWAKATNSLNSGYYKIADMYYATIRYILSLS